MLTLNGPPALSGAAPPDQQPESVPELCFKLQQAILRDGIVDPEERRAVGGLLESLSQHAAQEQAAAMAGQQPGMSDGTEDAFAAEGTEPTGVPDEGVEPMPYQ